MALWMNNRWLRLGLQLCVWLLWPRPGLRLHHIQRHHRTIAIIAILVDNYISGLQQGSVCLFQVNHCQVVGQHGRHVIALRKGHPFLRPQQRFQVKCRIAVAIDHGATAAVALAAIIAILVGIICYTLLRSWIVWLAALSLPLSLLLLAFVLIG